MPASLPDGVRIVLPSPAGVVSGGVVSGPVEVLEEVSGGVRLLSLGSVVGGLRDVASLRFAHGVVQTSSMGWVRVEFSSNFGGVPSVVAVGQHRGGWFDAIGVQPGVFDAGTVADNVAQNAKDTVLQKVSIPIIGGALGDLAFWLAWPVGYVFAWLLNTAMAVSANQTQVAANVAAQAVHSASGLPRMLQTPASTRSVSRDAFELLGVPGGSFHWIAIGPR